jgi:hypothetical protein
MAYTRLLYWGMAFGKYTSTGEDYAGESSFLNQKKWIQIKDEVAAYENPDKNAWEGKINGGGGNL